MAEVVQPVAPAQATGQNPPAPFNLKFFTIYDANGVPTYVQAVCSVDDLGNQREPMSLDQGNQIIILLKAMMRLLIENGIGGGGLMPPSTQTGLEQEGTG